MKDERGKTRRETHFEKEDAYKSLDIVNNWISSMDSKTSVLLAYIGVLIGFVVSKGTPSILSEICETNPSFSAVFKLVNVVLLYTSIATSVMLLFLALKARVKDFNDKHSLLFFGEISKLKLNEYKSKILNRTEEDLIKDILEQVHTNSMICTKKARLYNHGLVATLISTGLYAACVLLKVF